MIIFFKFNIVCA